MAKILIVLDYYIPGYKSGGPLRTIENLVARLNGIFEFWIVTRDRDATDTDPYSNVNVNQWNDVNGAHVWYAAPNTLTLPNLRRLMLAVEPDVVYLNSFFSTLTIKVLTLRRLRAIPRFPTVLAPRGEFSPGALALKSIKKRPYIFLSSRLGLYNRLFWQVSSTLEEQELTAVWPGQIRVCIAPDIPTPLSSNDTGVLHAKTKMVGCASFIFLSRISPKKNLASAIRWMKGLSGDVVLGIYG
ncbi:MAG: hypothetical protein KC708_24315, partial [Anaerolineae bacterium]|nr:hypothetical protein [Anaerolineae bacterium]